MRRQIDHDLSTLMATVGRLSEPQLQLFFVLQSMVLSHKPEGLLRMTDGDVALAAGTLAGTLEASVKGLIVDESTASIPAEELRKVLRPLVDEVTKSGGTAAQREVALVLRAMERGARHEGGLIPSVDTAYLELVARVFQQKPQSPRPPDKPLILTP